MIERGLQAVESGVDAQFRGHENRVAEGPERSENRCVSGHVSGFQDADENRAEGSGDERFGERHTEIECVTFELRNHRVDIGKDHVECRFDRADDVSEKFRAIFCDLRFLEIECHDFATFLRIG